MMELRTAIFTYAYIKHSNSRSTCQNYKSKGLIFFVTKLSCEWAKNSRNVLVAKLRGQKYAEQKK